MFASSLRIFVAAVAVAGCSAQGPSVSAPAAGDTSQQRAAAPRESGSGMSSGGASSATTPEPASTDKEGGKGEKEKRGNTPPGQDRSGAGPAEGAIVDPTGAATSRKP